MSTPEPTVLMEERLDAIRGLVNTRHAVRVEDLCTELGVSPATVRRDLAELHRRGSIRKVHGGAVSMEGRLTEPHFDDKEGEAREEKDAIARAAFALIRPNDCIYLDGGSTVLALARLLTQMHPLTVVTNSLRVALALSGGNTRLILVGGDLRRLSQTFVGPLTQATIEQLHVDKAFMGTIGLSVEAGMTTTDPAEAFTKRLVMQHATQIVLLADSRKMGKVAFAQAGNLDQLDMLITDPHLDPHLERQLKRLGVDVTIAPLSNAKE